MPDEVVGKSPPTYAIEAPTEQTVPIVFASPHSGLWYPNDFIVASRLDPLALRRSEDAFIDQIYASAPRYGAPLLKALFPRAYVDPNREPFELDPAMFDGVLPAYVNTASARVAAGLGTVAKVVTSGDEIYRHKLAFPEVLRRIETFYFPYHQALSQLVERTRQRFGVSLLIDCHSMPSIGGPMDADPGAARVDFVLGDCHGTSCSPSIVRAVERRLTDLGYTVRRNTPYAGGYTTRHYSHPGRGMHALQIEINRSLYMDETTITPSAGLPVLEMHMEQVIGILANFNYRPLIER